MPGPPVRGTGRPELQEHGTRRCGTAPAARQFRDQDYASFERASARLTTVDGAADLNIHATTAHGDITARSL